MFLFSTFLMAKLSPAFVFEQCSQCERSSNAEEIEPGTAGAGSWTISVKCWRRHRIDPQHRFYLTLARPRRTAWSPLLREFIWVNEIRPSEFGVGADANCPHQSQSLACFNTWCDFPGAVAPGAAAQYVFKTLASTIRRHDQKKR